MEADVPAPFSSTAALRERFEAGLERLVAHDTLGVFVLALANASFERALFERLHGRLRDAFRRWERRFDAGDPRALQAAPDDRDVFERLRRYGFDRLEVTRWRQCGSWELQFNPLRAFRPPRMSDAVVDEPGRPFDPAAFNFNRPFLRDEILWEGEIGAETWRLLYNKFPFAPLHGLLVPRPADCLSQRLDADVVTAVWSLLARLGQSIPGIGLGYNAYGAYASVNHLHFQLYARDGLYPVERDTWSHNGGVSRYPLAVRSVETPGELWGLLADLHGRRRGYNLLLRPGRGFVVERPLQGSYRHSGWTGGFAWSECAGGVTLFDCETFDALDEKTIAAEFAAMAMA
jgi:diadenosine tetraphosphate (Ap4A) HIT family hydrolase